MRFIALASLVLTTATAVARADGPGGTLAQWREHMADLRGEPGLVRLYAPGDPGPEAGVHPPLAHAVAYGQPDEPPTLAPGRWPGTSAARLDRTLLTSDPFPVGPSGFTVELWFRKNGPGTLRGNDGATNGTLVSQGNGYWDGWRVTTTYPDNTFGFEIGRPQPSTSVAIWGAGPLPDGAWHHLAASWDGREMRLYLNGVVAGTQAYAGAYTPPAPGDRFRVGYAAAGWGSAKLDVDSVAVWIRALTPHEVLRHAFFHEAHAVADASALDRAAAALRAGRPVPAGARDLAALARLKLAYDLRARGDAAGSARHYAAVAMDARVADRFRLTALLPLLTLAASAGDAVPVAALERLANRPGAAGPDRHAAQLALVRGLLARPATRARGRALMDRLGRDPMTTPSQRLAMRIEAAHALRAAGDLAAAAAAYAALARDPSVPVPARSYCFLLLARTQAQRKQWAAAAAAYRAVTADHAADETHRYEATEGLREVSRLRRGLPARDPAASRVKLPTVPPPSLTLHVAPGGSDAAPGTRARPLATFAGAAAAVRAARAAGRAGRGPVEVLFRGGSYRVGRTVTLTREDGGTARAPVVYRAFPGERPVFTGGTRLTGFAPVTDAAILARLPTEARGRAVCLDLRAAGVADLGVLAPRGMGLTPAVPEIFWNGKALQPARWPNTGWATTGAVVTERAPNGGFTFTYDGDRPARWVGAQDAWVFGYWKYLWADAGVGIASIDVGARTLTTAHATSYGVQAGMPYYAYHLLEELDAPGEWHLDRRTGILTVWPPADPAKSTVEMSVLEAPFVEVDGASHLRLERLTFELGRSDGIVVKGGARCLVAGCTVRKLGGTAVTFDGGAGHGAFGCDLSVLGRGGTTVKGGDRRTLTPSGHFVENCRVSDFSRWCRTYTPAVQCDGVGVRIAHNLFERSPGHAMRIEGNDHVVEFNEVCYVVAETDDQGALDMWYNPTYRGVVIRHNFWHHIGDGQDRMMRAGIRLDDAICGVSIYGNVFWKAAEGLFGGVQIHGGKDNVVENNLFVDCKCGISFSRWGDDRWRQYTEGDAFRKATREDVDVAGPPYSVRYPGLARLGTGADVNEVRRNIAYWCGDFLARDGGIQAQLDNFVTARDPGFADARRGDFAIPAGSWVYGVTGFRPIPFEEIGRYLHPLAAK